MERDARVVEVARWKACIGRELYQGFKFPSLRHRILDALKLWRRKVNTHVFGFKIAEMCVFFMQIW